MLAIQKIRDEHRSISTVLHALGQLARDAQDARVKPDFAPLRAMIRYIDAYADFHWKHMRKEERELLPLAQRVLAPEDWLAIDAAFDASDDPVAGSSTSHRRRSASAGDGRRSPRRRSACAG